MQRSLHMNMLLQSILKGAKANKNELVLLQYKSSIGHNYFQFYTLLLCYTQKTIFHILNTATKQYLGFFTFTKNSVNSFKTVSSCQKRLTYTGHRREVRKRHAFHLYSKRAWSKAQFSEWKDCMRNGKIPRQELRNTRD